MRLLAIALSLAACTRSSPTRPRSEAPVANVQPVAAAASPAGRLPVGTGDYGTAHPTYFRGHDPAGRRWMALCQAREDTTGNGKIEVDVGRHGELGGDAMALYLVLGGGPGSAIDNLVSYSDDGRWVAILRGGKLELVDADTGEVFALADADTASDGRPGAPHRAAMFTRDQLLFVRHRPDADALVVHDVARHTEREIAVPDRLWRFAYAPDHGRIFTVPRGQGFPQLRTSLERGECLGPPMSYGTYGQSGPTPTERWIDLERGVEVPAPKTEPTPPEEPDHAPKLAGDALGPARW